MTNSTMRYWLATALAAGVALTATATALWAQDPAADTEALFAAKNVLLFVRGKAALARARILDVRHNVSGVSRASVVRLRWQGKKRRTIVSTVTMEMIHRPGLRKLYRLTYRDTLGPMRLPEQLLQVRERLNIMLAEEDLLLEPGGNWPAFENIPVVEWHSTP